MIGKRFGRLVVVSQAEPNKWGNIQWVCNCDCGNQKKIAGGILLRGDVRSCGCLGKENLKKLQQEKYKQNHYRIIDDIVYVRLLRSDNEMLCDIDDWDKLQKLSWAEETNGYARSRCGYFHKIICPTEEPFVVDHINRNKLDNRKENLRIVTRQFNALNNNSLGVTWHKSAQKWAASIHINGKHIHLGLFDNIQSAIECRKEYRNHIGIID